MIAYLPVWHAGFIWDDDLLVTANPLIKAHDGWYHLWFTNKAPDYFPVMSSVFWIEWRLWGMNAVGYHVVNVLLHAMNAVLVWRLLTRLNVPGANLAAAIFALHPANVESVVWIAELKNTMSFLFFALSLLWYLEFDDTGRRRWYVFSLWAFLFALLSKIEAAPLPFVLLGIAWWRRGQVDWKDIRRSVPFFMAAFVLGLVSVWFQMHVAIGHAVVRTDNFWSRLAGAGWAVWFYLGKALLPVHLIPIYPRWQIDPTNALSYLPGMMLVTGFMIFWLYRRSWGKALLFGLGYAVLMFLPVLGFINLSFFRYSLVSDHYQYFSIIGPIALAATGITMICGIWGKRNSWLKPAFCGALLLTLGVLTWLQCGEYADDEAFCRATIQRNPTCWLAHYNLGTDLLQKSQVNDAILEFKRALAIKPGFGDAHYNLGVALSRTGQLDDSIIEFRRALTTRRDDVDARINLGIALFQKGQLDEAVVEFQKTLAIKPDHALARYNLGKVLLQKGQAGEAIIQFQKALAIEPDLFAAHYELGNALLKNGQLDEAISQFQEAIRLKPDGGLSHNNLGNALLHQGQTAGAISQFQEAIRLNPDYAPAYYNLGVAFINQGQIDEAISQFQEAIRRQPDNAEAHSDLGVAFINKGQIDEAISQFQEAIRLNPDNASLKANLTNALEAKSKSNVRTSGPVKP